jgi:hypothetical protein
MHDLDDLLSRRETLCDLCPDGSGLHTRQERLHNGNVHIRLEQRESHLTHSAVYIVLGEAPLAAQPVKDAAESVG